LLLWEEAACARRAHGNGGMRAAVRAHASSLLASGGMIVLLIVAAAVGTALVQPRFFNALNIINILRNAAILSIASMGQMLVMIAGGFDLSVGVIVALASVQTALLSGMIAAWMPGAPVLALVFAVLVAMATGALIGSVSGVLVSRFRLSPFMVTLAMSSVVAGATFYVTKGIPIYGLPNAFVDGIGRGMVGRCPVVVLIAVAIVAIMIVLQRATTIGGHIYAVGSNLHAARISGVRVGALLISVYAVSGMAAAITGILLTARIGSGQSTVGGTMALETIAASVVGGVSLLGGVGRAERVMLGALFLSVVANALNLLRIDSKYQTLVLGVVLIAAVCIEFLSGVRRRND
jgi:ribose transport system permease protein